MAVKKKFVRKFVEQKKLEHLPHQQLPATPLSPLLLILSLSLSHSYLASPSLPLSCALSLPFALYITHKLSLKHSFYQEKVVFECNSLLFFQHYHGKYYIDITIQSAFFH